MVVRDIFLCVFFKDSFAITPLLVVKVIGNNALKMQESEEKNLFGHFDPLS